MTRPDVTYAFKVNTTAARGGTRAYVFWPLANGAITPDNVPAGWGFSAGCQYPFGDWEKQWSWVFDIPIGETPATYTVDIANNVTITVVADNTDTPSEIAAGNSRSAVISALSTTTRISLAAGIHYWEDEIACPADTQIDAYGATIVRTTGGAAENRILTPAGRIRVRGGTWRNEVKTGYLLHAFPRATGICELYDLKTEWNEIGASNTEVLAEDCHFHNSRYLASSLNVSRECLWTGQTRQPYFSTGGEGMLTLDPVFRGTTRGLVFQTGDMQGVLSIGARMLEINMIMHNEGELILLEDITGSKFTFVDVVATDCSGPGFMVFNYVADRGPSDIYMVSSKLHVDKDAIYLMSSENVAIDSVVIEQSEISSSVLINGAVTGNTFTDIKYRRMPTAAGNSGIATTDYSKQPAVIELGGADYDNQTWTNCEEVYADGQVVPFAKKA